MARPNTPDMSQRSKKAAKRVVVLYIVYIYTYSKAYLQYHDIFLVTKHKSPWLAFSQVFKTRCIVILLLFLQLDQYELQVE